MRLCNCGRNIRSHLRSSVFFCFLSSIEQLKIHLGCYNWLNFDEFYYFIILIVLFTIFISHRALVLVFLPYLAMFNSHPFMLMRPLNPFFVYLFDALASNWWRREKLWRKSTVFFTWNKKKWIKTQFYVAVEGFTGIQFQLNWIKINVISLSNWFHYSENMNEWIRKSRHVLFGGWVILSKLLECFSWNGSLFGQLRHWNCGTPLSQNINNEMIS